jgi:hypothetical protein
VLLNIFHYFVFKTTVVYLFETRLRVFAIDLQDCIARYNRHSDFFHKRAGEKMNQN